jgi:L-alanine-DL-glutamate epimerase-like enolase superfamily enzyme
MPLFFADIDVTWFEEPVSSDDLDGLRLLRDQGPAGLEIVAGEYGYDLWYFQRMLSAGAVDVLMPDVTRYGGISGFLQVGHLCDAFQIPFWSHCAPALSLHPCCALSRCRHMEYFHDHARIEGIFFDDTRIDFPGAPTTA